MFVVGMIKEIKMYKILDSIISFLDNFLAFIVGFIAWIVEIILGLILVVIAAIGVACVLFVEWFGNRFS